MAVLTKNFKECIKTPNTFPIVNNLKVPLIFYANDIVIFSKNQNEL